MKKSWGRADQNWDLAPAKLFQDVSLAILGAMPSWMMPMPRHPNQPTPLSKGQTAARTEVAWLLVQMTFHWGELAQWGPSQLKTTGYQHWVPSAPRQLVLKAMVLFHKLSLALSSLWPPVQLGIILVNAMESSRSRKHKRAGSKPKATRPPAVPWVC